MHPLLDFLATAGAIALGFLVATEPRGLLERYPPLTRYAAFLVIAYFVRNVLLAVFALLTPLFNGASSAQAVLQFLGGVIALGGLVAAYLAMRGDLKIQVQRPLTGAYAGPPESMAGSPGPNGPSAANLCPQCGRPQKEGAAFCSECGARVGVVGERPA